MNTKDKNSRNQRSLLDWREQFEAMFANLPVGISYLTPDMRYIRMNAFLENRMGLKSEEIEGKFCYDISGMYKDDPTRVGREKICDVCGVFKALETGETFKFVRKSRPDLIVENMGVPIKDDDGNIIGVAEIIIDITERVLMEEKLKSYATELEAAVEEKTKQLISVHEEFIAMLTHDLKTPLTSILGYSSLILEGDTKCVDADTLDSVEGIKINAQKMLGLVRNFLTAGKIHENKLSIEPMPHKLEAILLDAIKGMEPQYREKQITIDITFAPDLPRVIVDQDNIERVISNVISNAIKFTPENGRISIRSYEDNGFMRLEVEDSGEGISAEEMPMLFDKYYQGKNSSRGTGLGLFIAKNIVEAHNGDIKVTSAAGEGTTFTISLPLNN